jgi:CubicO group peptidase (beta-lactamase class C family)
VSIDWAGELVSRVSGLSLNDYFIKNIFEPIGIKDINMFPTEDMKSRLAYMHQKSPDGTLGLREDGHIFRRPLVAQSPDDIKSILHSGGGGAFAVPSDYCRKLILQNTPENP